VGVGGDQPHPGQAAGGQVPEEREPAGAVLSAGDLQTQDLPVPVAVHPDRDQRVNTHNASAFADLQHEGVSGHERVRTLIEWAAAERLDLGVEVSGHDTDLDFDSRVMPNDSTSFSIRRVDTPSR
jgi:hypothetical protein